MNSRQHGFRKVRFYLGGLFGLLLEALLSTTLGFLLQAQCLCQAVEVLFEFLDSWVVVKAPGLQDVVDWLGYFIDEAVGDGDEEQDLDHGFPPGLVDGDLGGEVVEQVVDKSTARSRGRRSGRARADLGDEDGDVEREPLLLLDCLRPDQLHAVLSEARSLAAENLEGIRGMLRLCSDSLCSAVQDKEHVHMTQRGGES